MANRVFDSLMPHYCCSCGQIGSILCDSCKYDIVSEPFSNCIVCLQSVANSALCGRHRLPYSHATVVGWRTDELEKLVDVSKFESVRQGCDIQAELLSRLLPHPRSRSVIIPIPTIRPHIRQRGYGHVERMARQLSNLSGLETKNMLERMTNHVQHGASRAVRQQQAAEAFRLLASPEADTTYILVDDVFTTGATLKAAAKLLREGGAGDVWVAVTTRQPRE